MPRTTPLRPSDGPEIQTLIAEAERVVDGPFRGSRYRAMLRRRFVVATDIDQRPPLSRMLAGPGRGGEARLKVYLTLLWLPKSTRHLASPHRVVDVTKERLAKLIGIYTPDTGDPVVDRRRDIRVRDRIDRSLRWLEQQHFVEREKYSSVITLLDDAGTGGYYSSPGDQIVGTYTEADYYFYLPSFFWTEGWIGAFGSDELAAYLALRSQHDFRKKYMYYETPETEWLWWSQTRWSSQIQLSRDMRYSGFNKLAERGIIIKESEPVHGDGFNPLHTRRKYSLNHPSLDGRVAPGG